jgi:hypothetical protein
VESSHTITTTSIDFILLPALQLKIYSQKPWGLNAILWKGKERKREAEKEARDFLLATDVNEY